MSTLDSFDLKILRILQQNNLTSQRDIARRPDSVHAAPEVLEPAPLLTTLSA